MLSICWKELCIFNLSRAEAQPCFMGYISTPSGMNSMEMMFFLGSLWSWAGGLWPPSGWISPASHQHTFSYLIFNPSTFWPVFLFLLFLKRDSFLTYYTPIVASPPSAPLRNLSPPLPSGSPRFLSLIGKEPNLYVLLDTNSKQYCFYLIRVSWSKDHTPSPGCFYLLAQKATTAS